MPLERAGLCCWRTGDGLWVDGNGSQRSDSGVCRSPRRHRSLAVLCNRLVPHERVAGYRHHGSTPDNLLSNITLDERSSE